MYVAKNILTFSINTFVVFVKSAKRHSASAEQKGVGCQHGEVQEVCSSKKMESKWFSVILCLIFTPSNSSFRKTITAPNYRTCPVTHHIPKALNFDSFLPKSLLRRCTLMSPRLLQARHEHQIYHQCCFSGRLLVCSGSSRLTQHGSQPPRNAGIVYLWWFGGAVMPCLCLLLRRPLRVWHTGSFWLCSNLDLTLSSFIFNIWKWHQNMTKQRRKYSLLKWDLWEKCQVYEIWHHTLNC